MSSANRLHLVDRKISRLQLVLNVTFSNLEAQRFSLAKTKKIPNTTVRILHNFHAAR